MEKIVVIVEGQTEQIFVRNLVFNCIDSSKITCECISVRGERGVRNFINKAPDSKFYILIVNVGNDVKVVSYIKNYEKRFFSKGYKKVFGLRDLYSKAYRDSSGRKINHRIIKLFIESLKTEMEKMENKDNIHIYYAIMEIEAWILGLQDFFVNIDSSLTSDYINEELGQDLAIIDPQTCIYKPSDFLNDILELCGKSYKKKKGDIENFVSFIRKNDLEILADSTKCNSFKKFFLKFKESSNDYLL